MKFWKIGACSLIIASLAVSCIDDAPKSEILGTKITIMNLDSISKVIENDADFTAEDAAILANGLIRLGMNKDSIVGKTFGDIYQMQKDYIKSQNLKQLAKTTSRVGMIINAKVNYAGLQINDEGEKKMNILYFDIFNTSNKDIKSIKGVLEFYNSANQLVKIYNVMNDKIIKTGETIRVGNPFIHDPANQRDGIIRTTKDLRTVWTPVQIDFTDGSSIKDMSTEQTSK